MVACPAKHPMHPTSNCYKKAIVRACCDRLREIEGRLEQSVGPRFEQQLQSCDDLCGVARLILMLQRRTELRDSDSGWLEARSRPPTKPTPKPNPSPKPTALPPAGSHPTPTPAETSSVRLAASVPATAPAASVPATAPAASVPATAPALPPIHLPGRSSRSSRRPSSTRTRPSWHASPSSNPNLAGPTLAPALPLPLALKPNPSPSPKL